MHQELWPRGHRPCMHAAHDGLEHTVRAGGQAWRGRRESGKENPYSCTVLAGARSTAERQEALQARAPHLSPFPTPGALTACIPRWKFLGINLRPLGHDDCGFSCLCCMQRTLMW
jgi:hypothetical protein